ncbi:uncharacterized protein LOC144470122 isoform X2 [Augochlora pura]
METMEASQYEYLKINKYLLYCIGQWPHQTLWSKILVGIVILPIIVTQTLFQVGGVIAAQRAGDIDAFAEGFAPSLISFFCIAKYTNFFNRDAMKGLLIVIQNDWRECMKSKEEFEILSNQYALGRRTTIRYTATIYGFMMPFMLMPTILTVINKLNAVNGTYERLLMFRVESFLDVEKYYLPLAVHNYVCTITFINIAVSCDSMIVQFVRHECGLCQIFGRRLQHILENNNNLDIELYPNKRDDVAYQTLKSCAKLHKHIFEFAQTLESTCTISYFFQLGFNMVSVSFTQFQAIVNLDSPSKSFGYASLSGCMLSSLLFLSLPAQHFTDAIECIYDYLCLGKWYQFSLSARKLLHIMLTKSIRRVELTAGKIYVFNLMNYSSVLQTSFSYCMVLCSFQ